MSLSQVEINRLVTRGLVKLPDPRQQMPRNKNAVLHFKNKLRLQKAIAEVKDLQRLGGIH